MLAPIVTAALLGAVSIGFGLALAMRLARSAGAAPESEGGLVRVRADVGSSVEQTMVVTVRSLELPRGEDVAYGALYLEPDGDRRLLVRSRSVIGRGLLATLDFTSLGRRTRVAYAIVRLPGDETIHAAVLDLEFAIVQALRCVDHEAEIHLTSSALRGVERARPSRRPVFGGPA